MWLKKSTNSDTKNSIETCKKTLSKPYFAPQTCCVAPLLNANNLLSDFSLMRQGKKLTKREKEVKVSNVFVFFANNYFQSHESH